MRAALPIEKQIKEKIERLGTTLKEWDININYGIKTGFNEAFIIDGKKKDELIDKDSKSAEIIHPLLRGRDIKKYTYNFADLWLINTHNGVKANDTERIKVEEYPAIKKHLDQYYPRLEKRADKGDTPYNLRNCAYLDDFNKPKIVYNDIAQSLTFALAEAGMFFNNTVYFISGEEEVLKYLITFLNSSLINWYYKTLSVQLGEKAMRLFSIYVKNIPIIKGADQSPLTDKVIELKKQSPTADTTTLESQIDQLVYELYGLTEEEIAIVEDRKSVV